MAYNLQNVQITCVPYIQQVFERSRYEWLVYEDIKAIFEIHQELVLSTEPANPEGIYLYDEEDIDTPDSVEWEDKEEPSAMIGEIPITFTIARCVVFIDPTVTSGRVLSTLERRLYKAETYGTFLLAHYRSIHMGGLSDEEEDSEEEDSEEEDSEDEDSEDEDSDSSDSSGDEDWNEAGEDDVVPEDGEHHPVDPADAAAAWSIDLGGDHANDVAPVAPVSNIDLSVPSPSLCLMTSAAFVIQQLTGPLLIRMVHTRDGSRLAMLCIKHGSAKERTKIIKAMKSHVGKMASDQFGSMVLACIFSIVDDTKLVTKIIVRELEATLMDLVTEKLHDMVWISDVCMENAEEILKSNVGKEVMYEVARGGADGILCPSMSEKLRELYEAIASVAAKPKTQAEPEKKSEHILEDFHSSRTIRRLVLDCPAFASILYKKALSGKCRLWAQGHCSKILSAFLETEDLQVREMAKEELQVLVNEGALKIPETKKSE